MLPVERFKSFVSEKQLFKDSSRVLVAVSGGKDSVLLAHLFNAAGLSFGIAHCNFRLRGSEANEDETFTEELAKQLGAPFYAKGFDTEGYASEKKISIQMAARQLRYAWFETIRTEFGYDCIALAHHKSDVIETVLLNLTRGTGIAGLHGILPKREKLIRPMLFLSREEIDAIIDSEAISYREDSSNSSTNYSRNKIRHEVVPSLKELNPNLAQTFEDNSRRFAEVEEFLELQISALRTSIFIPDAYETVKIEIIRLKALRPQKLILFELFKPYEFSEQVLADVAASFDKHPGRIFESPTHQLLLDRKHLVLSPKSVFAPIKVIFSSTDTELGWQGAVLTQSFVDNENLLIASDAAVAYTDADKLIYPLTLRSWKESDSFYPLGMKGKKKLSDFYIGLKIPLNQKSSIPVLENGNGEIIWIAGLRLDERYKITPRTKKVAIFGLKANGK